MNKMMLYDPQTESDNLILCFKNEGNYNDINCDQFVCDIPLNNAIQIMDNNSNKIDIDSDVETYLKGVNRK